MTELINLSTDKLKRILALKQQIEKLSAQLQALAGNAAPITAHPARKQRIISAAARRKMAAAARARWAKVKGTAHPAKQKRTMSAEARAKIAAAQKQRWAKIKAAKK